MKASSKVSRAAAKACKTDGQTFKHDLWEFGHVYAYDDGDDDEDYEDEDGGFLEFPPSPLDEV